MKESDRQRIIRQKLSRQDAGVAAPLLPTGFPALDSALGGGLPRARMAELFGPSSCGKTTLALQIAAQVQETAGGVAWIDAEHALDPAYAASLGVDLERFPLLRPESAEQALEIARRLAASGAIDLLVIDSAAALVPALELESSLNELSPGLQSRVLASGLVRLKTAAARSGTLVLWVNQIRMRVDSAGVPYETTAGGPALKLYTAVRVALLGIEERRMRFRVLKNKAVGAFVEGSLPLAAPLGFAKTP